MRVVHVSSEKSWRGGENQVAYLIDGLRRFKVEQFMACKEGSALEGHSKSQNVPHIALPFRNELDLFSAIQLKGYCLKHKIDLLHVHSAHAQSISIISHLLGNTIPLIVSRRVTVPVKNNIFSRFKYNYRGISRIVCISRAVEEAVRTKLHDTSKCTTVYSGVDLARFSTPPSTSKLHEEFHIGDSIPLIGTMGALTHEKDNVTFLRMVKILRDQLTAKYFIIGGGPLEASIRRSIDALGLGEDVIMTGERRDIPQILPSLKVMVATPISEGLSNSILEAFAAGVPVVATAVGGIPEILAHEENGLLAPMGNATELAKHVLRLLQDDGLRTRITRRALERIREFSPEKMVQRTYEIYTETLASYPNTSRYSAL